MSGLAKSSQILRLTDDKVKLFSTWLFLSEMVSELWESIPFSKRREKVFFGHSRRYVFRTSPHMMFGSTLTFPRHRNLFRRRAEFVSFYSYVRVRNWYWSTQVSTNRRWEQSCRRWGDQNEPDVAITSTRPSGETFFTVRSDATAA